MSQDKKSRPQKKPSQEIQMAQALLNSLTVRGTLDETDPRIINARQIIAKGR